MLAWRLSNTLEVDFCVAALEEALSKGRPQIFNTDQGSQFTSEAFTSMLLAQGVQVSTDGRGYYKEDNGGQGKDGPAGVVTQGGNGR